MTAHAVSLEVLVEEPSAEHALRSLLPKIVPGVEFEIRTFRGKHDLLNKLPARLQGYAKWAAHVGRKIVVLVDRDDDDCVTLKKRLEVMAVSAGLKTSVNSSSRADVLVLNRIAVEELEAWFFGDGNAINQAYPRVPASLDQKAAYRDPDSIRGGTWEALERELQRCGYHMAGLAKVGAASAIAQCMNVELNRSTSFCAFRDGLRGLVAKGSYAS